MLRTNDFHIINILKSYFYSSSSMEGKEFNFNPNKSLTHKCVCFPLIKWNTTTLSVVTSNMSLFECPINCFIENFIFISLCFSFKDRDCLHSIQANYKTS